MKHLGMKELLSLARSGAYSDHLDICSFCREQYELAVEFLKYSPETVHNEAEGIPQTGESGRSTYRLAAQSAPSDSPIFRLRRTWYFENNLTILRVIEDVQRRILTGFFISEHKSEVPLIHFDGIDGDFTPDANGVFDIGDAGINIEPMNVTLQRSE